MRTKILFWSWLAVAVIFIIAIVGISRIDAVPQQAKHYACAEREHVANLIGTNGEVVAEVWIDYAKSRRVYRVNGKFQDEEPVGWWIQRSAK